VLSFRIATKKGEGRERKMNPQIETDEKTGIEMLEELADKMEAEGAAMEARYAAIKATGERPAIERKGRMSAVKS